MRGPVRGPVRGPEMNGGGVRVLQHSRARPYHAQRTNTSVFFLPRNMGFARAPRTGGRIDLPVRAELIFQ